MKCPACQGSTHVLQTRGDQRRRECEACGERFTTIEVRTTRRDLHAAARLRSARQTLQRLGFLKEAVDA